MDPNMGNLGSMAMQPGPSPLDADEFEEALRSYFDASDDAPLKPLIRAAVEDVWPPDSFREHQQEAIVETISKLYVEKQYDVVEVSAPTGAGKSLIIYAAIEVLAQVCNRKSFGTTPLNTLIDQVDDDEFLDEAITIKGRNNYDCVHPHDAGTSVDKAVCQRVSEFDCEYKSQHFERGGCPYYGRKHAAHDTPEVYTNLSYLMANSMIPFNPEAPNAKLNPREALFVDECQNIEDFALQFVGFTASQRTVPLVWDQCRDPPRTEDVDRLAQWLRDEVMETVGRRLIRYEAQEELTEEQAEKRDALKEFKRKADNFLSDFEQHHWVATREQDDHTASVKFEPIFVGRFLDDFLWSQGNKVVLSSATIPRGTFHEEVGVDDKSVARVEVPSTFPPERRPIHTDMAVGKMTYNERGRTLPKLADRLADIADHHEGQNGFVHCHAYSIMENLYDALPYEVQRRTMKQDPDAREESLEQWFGNDKQVFLSVAMDEGISLDDDLARWQVVAKAAYPNMSDKRVAYRMDSDTMGGADWTWYSSKAAINFQQAVGRGMRSEDDWCHSYVLDQSAADILDRNSYLFEDWFEAAVDIEPSDDIPPRYSG